MLAVLVAHPGADCHEAPAGQHADDPAALGSIAFSLIMRWLVLLAHLVCHRLCHQDVHRIFAPRGADLGVVTPIPLIFVSLALNEFIRQIHARAEQRPRSGRRRLQRSQPGAGATHPGTIPGSASGSPASSMTAASSASDCRSERSCSAGSRTLRRYVNSQEST